MIKEILLLKLGEMVLKGGNRRSFEDKFLSNVRIRLKSLGDFKVYAVQSTVYVEPLDEMIDIDSAVSACGKVFGAVSVCRAAVCEKDEMKIFETAREYLKDELSAAGTFKVESKRSDKSFHLGSIQLSQFVGGELADVYPNMKADMKNPDVIVHVEVRDYAAFVHSGGKPGAGGMPLGINGRAACLLSGGIDSPVALHMIAKRGVYPIAVHFYSPPYTSQRSREKVLDLAKISCEYCGKLDLYIVPFTKIQEAIRENCAEEMYTILMRRFMMRLSQEIAEENKCKAIVTGESLGQVASQTMEALTVTEAVCSMPVLRPVICLDKEEIVTIARRIGTFETSIQPFEDCCTVFTPRHPKIRPRLGDAESAEKNLDVDSLVSDALENKERVLITL